MTSRSSPDTEVDDDDGGGTGNKAYEDVEAPPKDQDKKKSESVLDLQAESGPRSLTGGTRV